ncbi:MAG: hypothetical protein MJ246_06285 [Clostridia bacterium]|nr:hypothetical protein [Clostridia bacterium]
MDEDRENEIQEPEIDYAAFQKENEDAADKAIKKLETVVTQRHEAEKNEKAKAEEYDNKHPNRKPFKTVNANADQAVKAQIKAEEQKKAYAEIAEKVKREREERQERIEAISYNKEDKHPNSKGELVRSLGLVLLAVTVIISFTLIMTSETAMGFELLIIGGLGGAICLGLSECVRLLQKIYDFLVSTRKR